MVSVYRPKSQGYQKNLFSNSELRKFRDNDLQKRLSILSDSLKLRKEIAKNITLYKFPIDKCREIKAYDILDQYMPEKIKEEKGKKKEPLIHHMEQVIRNMPRRDDDGNIIGESNEKNLNLRSLSIISYQLAEQFANERGFQVGKLRDTELAETHYYFVNTDIPKTGQLDRHIDDRAAVSYKTITLIWYLIKSPTVKDGNIRIYNSEYERYGEPEDAGVKIEINYDNIIEKNNEQKCICLIFNGNIPHQPEQLSGEGERSAIVFQFERIDKRHGNRSLNKTKTRQKRSSAISPSKRPTVKRSSDHKSSSFKGGRKARKKARRRTRRR